MTFTTQSTDYRHACDIVWQDIDRLRNTFSLSWRKIACTPKYRGIPAGTLCAFYKGEKEIPVKYRARLGIPYELPAPACPTHGIVHCYDCTKETVKPKTQRKVWKQPKRYPRGYAWLFEQMWR